LHLQIQALGSTPWCCCFKVQTVTQCS
jgi:hypothetical protein